MEKQERIAYWLDIAEYDLETARAMFASGRYLYVVFMCQQALEKTIKALYIHCFDAEPPKSHNLAFIFNQCGFSAPAEMMTLFTALSAHYLNNRYPEYRQKLSTLLDQAKAQEHLTNTEKAYLWLTSHLK